MPSHYKDLPPGVEREEALAEHQEQTGGMPYIPFKMKGFSGFKSSPAKHKTPKTSHEHNKKHADGYTHNNPVGDEKLIWTKPKAS